MVIAVVACVMIMSKCCSIISGQMMALMVCLWLQKWVYIIF